MIERFLTGLLATVILGASVAAFEYAIAHNLFWLLLCVPGTVLGVLIFFAVIMYLNLPSTGLEAADEEEVDEELLDLIDAYHRLGFELVGPAYHVKSKIPTVLIVMVHRQACAYGSIMRLSPANAPKVISYDITSELVGGGDLTTVPGRDGAIFPWRHGKFSQIFLQAAPCVLFQQHNLALRWLQSQGVRIEPADRERFLRGFVVSIAATRRDFRRRWLRYSATALWRMATRRNPNMGPLSEQREAQWRVESFVRGPAG